MFSERDGRMISYPLTFCLSFPDAFLAFLTDPVHHVIGV